jgi:Excreted virulence factor EspC, type VII ESX diderm
MPGFQVNTDELAAGRGHQDMIASALGGAAGMMRAAGTSIADAAGHPGAATAGTDFGSAWEGELAGRAEFLRRTGENLAAAAEAYKETDAGQMRT